jgi:hypothetical protein
VIWRFLANHPLWGSRRLGVLFGKMLVIVLFHLDENLMAPAVRRRIEFHRADGAHDDERLFADELWPGAFHVNSFPRLSRAKSGRGQ